MRQRQSLLVYAPNTLRHLLTFTSSFHEFCTAFVKVNPTDTWRAMLADTDDVCVVVSRRFSVVTPKVALPVGQRRQQVGYSGGGLCGIQTMPVLTLRGVHAPALQHTTCRATCCIRAAMHSAVQGSAVQHS